MNILLAPTQAFAQGSFPTYNGGGLLDGIKYALQIIGPAHMTLREFLINVLYKALDFLALAGVVMIVIAGYILILSNGSETQKDRAKRIALHVMIGLLLVIFSRVLVGFFLQLP